MFGMVAARRSARAARNTSSLAGSRAALPMLAVLVLGACSRETPPEQIIQDAAAKTPGAFDFEGWDQNLGGTDSSQYSSLAQVDKTNVGTPKGRLDVPDRRELLCSTR